MELELRQPLRSYALRRKGPSIVLILDASPYSRLDSRRRLARYVADCEGWRSAFLRGDRFPTDIGHQLTKGAANAGQSIINPFALLSGCHSECTGHLVGGSLSSGTPPTDQFVPPSPYRMKRLESPPAWRATCRLAVFTVLGMRVALGAVMASGWLAVRPYLSPVSLTNPTVYGRLNVPTSAIGEALMGVWLRRDAIHHLNIALLGYSGVSEGDTVFYPLYALLVRFLAQISRLDYPLCGLIVSTLAAGFAFACLHRMVAETLGATSAFWSVLALAAYPTSFFLLAPYSESLYLALTLGAFLAGYHHRWGLATSLGSLASLTRGPGILTGAALGLLAWEDVKTSCLRSPRKYLPVIITSLLPLLSGLGFLWWRRQQGFAPIAEVLRTYTHQEFTDPLTGLGLALKQAIVAPNLLVVLEALTALLMLCLLAAMILNKRWRRPEWVIFMGLNLAVLLSRHDLQAAPLKSLGRYAIVLFPAFIVMGDWLAHANQRVRFAILVTSASLLLGLSTLFGLWWFVG